MAEIEEDIRGLIEHLATPMTLDEVKHRATSHTPSHSGFRGTRLRRRVTWLVVPLAVALGLTLGSVFGVLPGSGKPPSALAAVLNQAATAASGQPVRAEPSRGQYLYYETIQRYTMVTPAPVGAPEFPLFYTQTVQTWVARDGSGRQRVISNPPTLVFPSDRQAWIAAGQPNFRPPNTDTYYPTKNPTGEGVHRGANGKWYLPYIDSSQFPTNPSALQRYMKKYFKITGGTATTFLLAGNMLQEGASPALRAAIFKLVEQLPGVTVVPHARDLMGRAGVGVALNAKQFGVRYLLVFNPRTSAVLGFEDSVASAKYAAGSTVSFPIGTLVGYTEFGPTAVVGSTSVTPR